MKRLTLAAALLACSTLPLAQMYSPPPTQQQIEAPKQRAEPPKSDAAPAIQVEVPKHKCEPKPVFPGGAAQMAMENKRRAFERDRENYRKCMIAFIDERKAFSEANQAVHKAAVDEYNATMKAINDAIEANR